MKIKKTNNITNYNQATDKNLTTITKQKNMAGHKPDAKNNLEKQEDDNSDNSVKSLTEKLDRELQKLKAELSILTPEQNKIFNDVALSRLTKRTECKEIAISSNEDMKPANNIEKMLIDQMSAVHVLSFKWIAQVYKENSNLSIELGNRIVNAATRLMEIYQKGAITLHKLRTGGKQTVIVKHQYVQVTEGGQALITDEYKHGGSGDNGKK